MSFEDAPGPFHHAGCLGCGADNPHGLGVDVHAEGGRIVGTVRFDEHQAGAPGYVHGGAVATALDDVLGTVPMLLGHPSVTASFTVEYRAPITLGTTAEIAAWPVRQDGRKFYVAGDLREGDTLIAEATGLFIEAPADRFPPGAVIVGRW